MRVEPREGGQCPPYKGQRARQLAFCHVRTRGKAGRPQPGGRCPQTPARRVCVPHQPPTRTPVCVTLLQQPNQDKRPPD